MYRRVSNDITYKYNVQQILVKPSKLQKSAELQGTRTAYACNIQVGLIRDVDRGGGEN